MRPRFALLGGSLLVAGSASCSLFGDFGGFSGGGDDESIPDGGDAQGEANSPVDAAAPPDATKDDGEASAGDAGRCVVPGLVTRMCDDFDRTTWNDGWPTWSSPPGSVAEIVVDPQTSSRVFHASVPGVDGGYAQAYVQMEPTMTSRIVLRFDMKYTALPTTNGRQIGTIKLLGTPYNAFLSLEPGGLSFVEQVTSAGLTTHDFNVTPPVNTWFRVSLDLDLATDKVTILVDGVPALPAGEPFPLLPTFAGTSLAVACGIRYSTPPSSPFDAMFDNVVIATD